MPTSSSSSSGIPEGFYNDLVRRLALLRDAPPGIAESTIALFPFGTRAILQENDPPLIEVSDHDTAEITITPTGHQIIEACAKYVENAEGPDWDSRYIPEDDDSDGESYEEVREAAIDSVRDDPDDEPWWTRGAKRVATALGRR